ncbi:hypothetical protein K501DRAFT_261023 [Backusella circina FSU 941]|nr:hypothetical protein K501DRAFT_261023 [Backusella circina FSU 941]
MYYYFTDIITALFSYDTNRQRAMLDQYYFTNATFLSPIMRTEGVHNIKQVLLVWKTLNRIAPKIENICYNEKMCIVFLKQTISPRLFPLIRFEFPVTVILKFQEETQNGIIKINQHEEHWTIEGILSSVPFISFWYNHVLRKMMGKIMTFTGETVQTAAATASLLVSRHRELDIARRNILKRIEMQCCSHIKRIEDGSSDEEDVLSFTLGGSNEMDYKIIK